MVTEEKIKRINELARESKKRELTDAEKEEQQKLRKEYIQSIRNSVVNQLENIEIID